MKSHPKNKFKVTRNVLRFVGVEVLPILLFLCAYHATDFRTAIITLAIATTFSIAMSLFIDRRIPWFSLVVSGSTVFAAIATAISDNQRILILRDTIYYVVFGITLLAAYRKNILLLKKLFERLFGITDQGWGILQRRWGILLITLGSLNYVIGFYLPLSYWVNYKAGILIIFLIFGLSQFSVSRKYKLEGTNSFGMRQ